MASENITNGRFRWEFNYRTLGGDEGLSVRLLGPADNATKELARFDCFHKTPHYHTAVYDHNTIRAIEDADPVSWFLNHIRDGFEVVIEKSGGDAPNAQEITEHAETFEKIERSAKKLVDEATRTPA